MKGITKSAQYHPFMHQLLVKAFYSVIVICMLSDKYLHHYLHYSDDYAGKPR